VSAPEVLSARDERCARCQGTFDEENARAECSRCFAPHHAPCLGAGCAVAGCGAVAAPAVPEGVFRMGFGGARTVVYTGKGSILLAGLIALVAGTLALLGLVCFGIPMAIAGALGSVLRIFSRHEDRSIVPGSGDPRGDA
jgi:hypothetical protein